MKKTTLFKQYLLAQDILPIPVAHDPLGAKIIERAGFKVLGCGGYANSAAFATRRASQPSISLATEARCGFVGDCVTLTSIN